MFAAYVHPDATTIWMLEIKDAVHWQVLKDTFELRSLSMKLYADLIEIPGVDLKPRATVFEHYPRQFKAFPSGNQLLSLLLNRSAHSAGSGNGQWTASGGNGPWAVNIEL